MDKGILYVVATPIGNLGDITYRAIQVLTSVDLILAEDTRYTKKLLDHYQINTPSISYRDQNHTKALRIILDKLDQGNSLALVSDSGTPCISDPGFKLVSELRTRGYGVISIPGPSAFIGSASISGLPTDKLIFVGFLPKKESQRKKIIKEYGELDATLTIYESPFRLTRLLSEVEETLGDRQVSVVSELTKKFESVTTGSIAEVKKQISKPRGEYVVLVAKKDFKHE